LDEGGGDEMEVESATDADFGEEEPEAAEDEAIVEEDSEIDAQTLAKVLAAMMKQKKAAPKTKARK
jgi:hypothetical protein